MRKLILAVAMLAAIFVGNRTVHAAYQCAFPVFAHSTACFVHDVLTGEDL